MIKNIKFLYGKLSNNLSSAIDLGLLPKSFANYRQTRFGVFSSETLESEHEADDVDGVLKICSIGYASNLPNTDRFFVRTSSAPKAGSIVVSEFLDHLFQCEEQFYASIPKEIKNALDHLDERIETKFSSERTEIQNLLRSLKKFTEFPIFGFNNGKSYDSYDINHIIWLIVWCDTLS